MADETGVDVVTVLAGLVFLGLLAFVVWKARQNRAAAWPRPARRWPERTPWKAALDDQKPSMNPRKRTSK